MIICPYCGDENIDGADVCEQCQQPLAYLSKPRRDTAIERRIHRDLISTLPRRKPLLVAASTPIADVLRLMVQASIGCVLVEENDQLVGIFTERDALLRLNAEYADFRNKPVSEVMTRSPETLEEDTKIAFALHKMDLGGYRHIPILRQAGVCGVISVRDILRYIADLMLIAEET